MNKHNNIALSIVIALVILLFLGGFGMIGFGSYGMGGMMQWMFGEGFGFMWIFGWLIMILILAALIFFIFWLIKQLNMGSKM